MSKANEQLIRDFMGCISTQGFAAAIRKYVSPDVIWWWIGRGEVQDRLSATGGKLERILEIGHGLR